MGIVLSRHIDKVGISYAIQCLLDDMEVSLRGTGVPVAHLPKPAFGWGSAECDLRKRLLVSCVELQEGWRVEDLTAALQGQPMRGSTAGSLALLAYLIPRWFANAKRPSNGAPEPLPHCLMGGEGLEGVHLLTCRIGTSRADLVVCSVGAEPQEGRRVLVFEEAP